MRKRTIAAAFAMAAAAGVAFALAGTVDVGYDNGHVGVDVAGRYAVEITAHGAKVGPAARSEDAPYEGQPYTVWACAVHGNRTCGR